MKTAGEEEDEVILQVMWIPSMSCIAAYQTMLWDTTCSGIFLRNAHAKRMKFPSIERRLKVCIL